MKYWLVMPAAGIGRRFGTEKPKQYAPLCGRTVIEWALAHFLHEERCAGVVVALAQDDPYWATIAPSGPHQKVRKIARRRTRSNQICLQNVRTARWLMPPDIWFNWVRIRQRWEPAP